MNKNIVMVLYTMIKKLTVKLKEKSYLSKNERGKEGKGFYFSMA